jgi:hypothetical protein
LRRNGIRGQGSGVVSLARAVPRAWFASANASLSVSRAPVSRQLLGDGAISFDLQRQGAAHTMVASIGLGSGAEPGGAALKHLSLRLRMPVSWGGQIKSVTSGTGEDWTGRLQPAKPGASAKDVLLLAESPHKLPSAAELRRIVVVF